MSKSTAHKLRPMQDHEQDRVLELWREQFGFYSEEYAQDWVDDAASRDRNDVWCFTAGSDVELAGFLIVNLVSIEEFDGEFEPDTSDWPKAVTNCELYMICVDDDWKNRGVAKALVRRAYKWLRRNGIKRVYGVSWHREDAPDSRLLFRSFGFRKLHEMEGYYQTGEDDPARDCPDCGTGCECPASFWTTTVEGDE